MCVYIYIYGPPSDVCWFVHPMNKQLKDDVPI